MAFGEKSMVFLGKSIVYRRKSIVYRRKYAVFALPYAIDGVFGAVFELWRMRCTWARAGNFEMRAFSEDVEKSKCQKNGCFSDTLKNDTVSDSVGQSMVFT